MLTEDYVSYEVTKHNYCTRCSHYTNCGFISRGLEYKCDILDIFDAGVDAAIDKASQWLQENCIDIVIGYLRGYTVDDFIEQFKKAMQDESK